MQEKMFNETNMEEITEEGNVKKKKKRGSRGLFFLITFVCFIAFVVIHCISNYGIRTKFDSIDQFDKYGGAVLVDLPEGVSDIKYYCNKIFIFGLESAYSFVINDKTEYDAFMETNNYKIYNDRTVGEYTTNPPKYNDVFQIRDWHIDVAGEDINDYNILDYDSFDGSYHAVIVDTESRRFVVIKFATL